MPVSIGVHLNLLDEAHVVHGHIAAWRHGRSEEHYLLGNCNTTLPEALTVLGNIVGRPPPRLRAPSGLVLVAAYVDALLEGVVLRWPPCNPLEAAGLARQ